MDRDAARAAAAAALASGDEQQVAAAVRATLGWLAAQYPGRAVEIRVPPYHVVQAVAGASHRRGTPPAVVETDPTTWLRLVSGDALWDVERTAGRLSASGERSDLSTLLE